MMKLPLADCWIIANYPVFRAALQMPLSFNVGSIYLNPNQYYTMVAKRHLASLSSLRSVAMPL
jgi:hypothetical protein